MEPIYRNVAIVAVLLIAGAAAYYALVITAAPASDSLQKKEFGQAVPPNFPTDIPIENGAQVQQSYAMNEQAGSEQLTVVFLSKKSVQENYAVYVAFLRNNQWNVLNMNDDATVSAVYGTKAQYDINVTISEHTVPGFEASQVSISILKKA